MKAVRALQVHRESVQQIHSPVGLFLGDGAKKPPYSTPVEVLLDFRGVDLGACRVGSKSESTQSSTSLHWLQKAMQAIAQTAASNGFES